MGSLSTFLNTREWASLLVLVLILIGILSHRQIRGAFVVVLRHFFARHIIKVLFAGTLYIATVAYCLNTIGLWLPKDLSATIVWSVTSATITIFNFEKARTEPQFYRNAAAQVFALATIFMFVTDLLNLSVWFWLVAIPLFSAIHLLTEFSLRNPEAASARKLFSWIESAFGIALLVFVAYRAIDSWEKVASLGTLRLFSLSAALSILFLPFIFGLVVYSAYESVFSRLPLAINDRKLRRRAKWKSMWFYKFDHAMLERWQRRISLMSPKTPEALDRTFQDIAVAIELENSQKPVPVEEGWQPREAMAYLADQGLIIKEYNQFADLDDWNASSSYLDVGGEKLSNNISYSIRGTVEAVTRLRLRLNVYDPAELKAAYERFACICKVLISRSVGGSVASGLHSLLTRLEAYEIRADHTTILLSREDRKYTGTGHSFILTVEHDAFESDAVPMLNKAELSPSASKS